MNNLVTKYAKVAGLSVGDDEMAKINALAIKELTADEVFTFRVSMCDNEVDRDFECFTSDALKELAELFKGKTVISDHRWSSKNQVARIYETELLTQANKTLNDESYTQLIAKCYMLKSESNAEIIAAIEAGITKEVSVGCSIKSAVCSICGMDNRKSYCEHYNGMEYDGKTCFFALTGARDAYELSFVAVPAQRNAGITKSYGDKPYEPEEKQNTGNEALTLSVESVGAFLFAKKNKLNVEE